LATASLSDGDHARPWRRSARLRLTTGTDGERPSCNRRRECTDRGARLHRLGSAAGARYIRGRRAVRTACGRRGVHDRVRRRAGAAGADAGRGGAHRVVRLPSAASRDRWLEHRPVNRTRVRLLPPTERPSDLALGRGHSRSVSCGDLRRPLAPTRQRPAARTRASAWDPRALEGERNTAERLEAGTGTRAAAGADGDKWIVYGA
jgi:hypothetical protein